MRRVYSSPIIDGVYVLNYANAPVRRKEGDLNVAATGNNKIIEDARKEIEASKQEMYRKGISDGCKQVEDRLSTVFKAIQDATSQLQRESCNIWQKSETEIIKLVLAIAQKVIGCEVANNNHLIEKVVAEAILQAGKQKIVSIRLNPADVTRLEETKITADFDSKFEIVADQKISPGGCVVETDFGCIDAQLETRTNEIINAFTHRESEVKTQDSLTQDALNPADRGKEG